MTQSLPTQQELPIACDPTGIPADQREKHFSNADYLFGTAVQERKALHDGYAFRFDADTYEKLAAFIAHERRCCPFFRFTLEIAPAQGPIWLHITGGDGVKEFIETEFVKSEE